MGDTLCVNEITFNDLKAINNDIYEDLEEVGESYRNPINLCTLDINDLKKN